MFFEVSILLRESFDLARKKVYFPILFVGGIQQTLKY